jgi:hypothetical protein
MKMDDLIQALNIFRKYNTDKKYPTGCEHDVLYVYVDPAGVSDEDIKELDKLGFNIDDDIGCFSSFRFGSA